MGGVYSCLIHFLLMLLLGLFLQLAGSKNLCAVCQQPGFNCKKLYPNCDSKALVSVCFDDNKYYCMEIEARRENCLLCQQNGFSCKKRYPNCDSEALLSLCFMDNKYYCVEKLPEDKICPLCQENGFSCKKTYPNCDSEALLSLCFKDNTYYCVEKDPGDDNCQRCTEPGYQCVHPYPNCSSEFTTGVCISDGHLLCVERLPYTQSSSRNRVTTTVPTVTTSKLNNNSEECHFSKIGLRPPASVTVCRENCLPVQTYIDLSKIGICSRGVCCLDKIQTTEKCAGG